MGRTEDLVKLDRSIKEAENRIKSVKANLDVIDKEIKNISTLEKTLKENIKCLKAKQIIAVAQEFKKSKEELKRSQNKLVLLGNDRDHLLKAAKDTEDFINLAKKELDKLQNVGDSNVIKFGRKDNG